MSNKSLQPDLSDVDTVSVDSLELTMEWSDTEGAFVGNPVPTSKVKRYIDFENQQAYIEVYEGELAREVFLAENDYTKHVETGDVEVGDDTFEEVGDGIHAIGTQEEFEWEEVSGTRLETTGLSDDSMLYDVPHVPHGNFVEVDEAYIEYIDEDWSCPSEFYCRVVYENNDVFEERVTWSPGADVSRPGWAKQD